jgi:lipoprotein-anchoring transpeptidase ErfK/SrfK
VNNVHRCVLIGVAVLIGILPASGKKKHSPKSVPTKTEIETATRLQIFLDRANFTPGRINGCYDDFTWKAVALYRESRGEPPQSPPPQQTGQQPNLAPDVNGLDLGSIDPVFIPYTITEADLQSTGDLPSGVAAKAKLKFLPYRNAADAIAEKFHSDIHFLEQLNPGKLKAAKAGDQLSVPNVEPFELASVRQIEPGSETSLQPANEIEYQPETQTPTPAENLTASRNVGINIDTKTNMLGVFEDGKLIAAYPVTVGSEHTASPIGDWKVVRITKLPTFRYDKEMLQHGQRSGDFHLLAPGPRNPAGVMWIALNKKGIGIHGTDDPDSIGRNVSHGCIRLANWDVVRLAAKIKPGDKVSIY